MIDLEAEVEFLSASLTTAADDRRQVIWRGFRFHETFDEHAGKGVVVTHAEMARHKYYYVPRLVDQLSDEAWLKNIVNFPTTIGSHRHGIGSYDDVPWEIHTIEDLTTYLTALQAYDRSRG